VYILSVPSAITAFVVQPTNNKWNLNFQYRYLVVIIYIADCRSLDDTIPQNLTRHFGTYRVGRTHVTEKNSLLSFFASCIYRNKFLDSWRRTFRAGQGREITFGVQFSNGRPTFRAGRGREIAFGVQFNNLTSTFCIGRRREYT
jgi:hypothetical protein